MNSETKVFEQMKLKNKWEREVGREYERKHQERYEPICCSLCLGVGARDHYLSNAQLVSEQC